MQLGIYKFVLALLGHGVYLRCRDHLSLKQHLVDVSITVHSQLLRIRKVKVPVNEIRIYLVNNWVVREENPLQL